MQRKKITKITSLAIILAMLIVIETIEGMLLRMPQGGSLSLSSLVFILAALMYTKSEATLLFLLWRTVIFIFVPPYFVSVQQFVLEYYLAYFIFLGIKLVGFEQTQKKLLFGLIIANATRLLIHTVSGVIFFPEYATGPVWQYSFGYNASYMVPTLLIQLVLTPFLYPVFNKMKITQ